MKRTLVISGIVALLIIISLIVFNRLLSKKSEVSVFAEVKEGLFEIAISNSGELLVENSFDIKGPEIQQTQNQGGGSGRGGGGHDHMRIMSFKIQDIVPEGTLVKKGDYIAQLDRTDYDNTLKDALESLTTLQANLEMKILDTTVMLTDLRDEIKNQVYVVEEARITLAESRYEPPATIRQAEINLNKAERGLEQLKKSYNLRRAQSLSDIKQTKQALTDGQDLVKSLQEYVAKREIIWAYRYINTGRFDKAKALLKQCQTQWLKRKRRKYCQKFS